MLVPDPPMEINKPPPLTTIMDLLLDAICVVDRAGRYLYVNAGFERMLGYRADEVIGHPMIDLVHPDDRARTLEAAGAIMGGRASLHFQNRYVHKDGRTIDIMWAAHWSESEQARVAVGRDISALKRAEAVQGALLAISEAAHASEDLPALFQQIHRIVGGLLPAANFFVALLDPQSGQVAFPYFVDEHDTAPDALPRDLPTLSNEVIGRGRALLITPETIGQLPPPLQRLVGHEPLDWLGVPLRSNNGVIGALVVQSYNSAVRYSDEDRSLLEFVSEQIASAIERQRSQARLRHLVGHDALTGLANRSHFHDRLDHALAAAQQQGTRLAVLYLDLDGFKQVNDRHGHALGDQLLREVARRIRDQLRRADTVGRLGGDEFVVLLEQVGEPSHAWAAAEKIRTALLHPFELEGATVRVSVSIGMAMFPEHGDDKRPLLGRADRAMYEAKKQGGNGVVQD